MECANGFLCKSKMKKIHIQATLAPLWFSKFGVRCSTKEQEAAQFMGKEVSNDVAQELEEVATNIQNMDNTTDWKHIWSQLHHAKGALMLLGNHCEQSTDTKVTITDLITLIDSLRNVDVTPKADLQVVLDRLLALTRDLN